MIDLTTAHPVSYVHVIERARGVAFYRDTLGLAHSSADEHGDSFALGAATLRLTAMPDWKPSAHPVIGWEVADIDATVAALVAKGLTMTIYDGMEMDANGIWRAPDGRAALAWFSDPDGNCLMLSQHLAG